MSNLLDGKIGKSGTITDVLSPGSYNAVTHVKDVWECPLHTVESSGTFVSGEPRLTALKVVTSMGAAAASEWSINSWPYMEPDTTLVAEATTQMDPQRVRPSSFNAVQFIGELREARDSLGLACGGIGGMLRKFLRGYANFVANGITFHDAINLAIKLDLSWKFAVKPMLADIKSALDSFAHLRGLFDRLRNPKPFRVYGSSSRTSNKSCYFSGYPYYYHYWGNEISYKKEVITWALVKWTNPLGAILNSDMEEVFSQLSKRYDIMLKFYRFNAPIRTGWELMPLSFVVDWFIDFGSWLDRFDIESKISMPFQVLASGYSVKKTADSNGYVKAHAGMDNARLQDITKPQLITGRLVRTTYTRVVSTLPWGSHQYAPPVVRIPSFGKLATLLELITLWSGLLKPTDISF